MILTNEQLSNKELHYNNVKDRLAENLSEQYAPIDSQLFLKPFLDRGWKNVKRASNKKASREWFTLENDAYAFNNGDKIRLEVLNSYDGTSSLKILAGIGRLVCSNGLVIGKDFEQFRYVHRGNRIYENLENDYEKIVAHLQTLKEKVDRLNNIYLSPMATISIINDIASKLFNSDSDKQKVKVLTIDGKVINNVLTPHRELDQAKDAWTVLNVVQENIVRRGELKANIAVFNKENNTTEFKVKSKRGNENKLSSFELNKLITDQFLKAVA